MTIGVLLDAAGNISTLGPKQILKKIIWDNSRMKNGFFNAILLSEIKSF